MGIARIMHSSFGGVTYYSLRYSMQIIRIFTGSAVESIIWDTKDSILLHITVAASFLVILLAVDALLKKCRNEEKWMAFFLYIVMVVTLGSSLVWVLNGNFYAQNDSRSVLECVGRIRNGDFSDLPPAGYLGGFQNQLGIAAVFQFFFFIFRTDNDIVIQVVNALCVPCIIFAGNGFLKEINCGRLCHICYLVSMLFCFPLLFYTPFVYGEILSVTAGSFFIWSAVCYIKRGRITAWVSMLTSAVIGDITRGNFPVLLIAFGIMAALYSVRRKNVMPIACAVTVFFAAMAGNKACYAYYEHISGIKLDQGIPLEGWIAMGLNDNAVAAGRYNGYNVEVYARHDYNREEAKKECLAYIHDRLLMLSGGSWKSFYKEKFLVQWNDPTLSCFQENCTFIPEAKIPVIMEIVLDDGMYYQMTVEFMNQYQLIIYLGILFYCIAAFKCRSPFYQFLPLIVIFGGFLFTMLWETMARYVFPYFIYMIPLSAIGWGHVGELLKKVQAIGSKRMDA